MNYIFGYGSLLSAYSRRDYSGIETPVIPATITGWFRAWCAVYPDEGATYAGALPDKASHLDGVLIASDIDDDLRHRERGYKFSRLNLNDIQINNTHKSLSDNDHIVICETLPANFSGSSADSSQAPLPQTYLDTCLIGCLESQGMEGVRRFIQQTRGWNRYWVNDRHQKAIYPRSIPITKDQTDLIDALLNEHDVLRFRQNL